MAKDLIIGGASNYTWNDLKYWVNSIKRSGFEGDVVLVATNITKETIDKLVSEGIKLSLYGKKDENGNIVAQSNGAPHVERFFYLWNFLKDKINEYDYVITTDTRDVVFQSNPTAWIDENLHLGETLVASSEGMTYESEPWNNRNLLDAFGPFFHQHYKSMNIHNVGVIAGEITYVKDLLFMIFQMSINRPIPVVDQVVFNILLQQQMFKETTKHTTNKDAWAVQLGTTLEAVKSGSGDIGLSIQNDPTKLILYQTKYNDTQPTITEEGYITNVEGTKFCVVHQYDRVAGLKEKIETIYS